MPNAVLTKCSDANYGLIDAINFSSFKHFLVSPRHYQHSLTCEREETPAMRLGTAIHSAVLRPDDFKKEYIKAPVCDRRTTEGKRDWADFISMHGDRKILNDDEWSTCLNIQRSFESNEFFNGFLANKPMIEVVMVGELFGVPIKGRLDLYDEHTNTIFDLKSITGVPSIHNCTKALHDNLYYIQAYWYQMLVKHTRNVPLPRVVFGFVEKAQPNSIGLINPGDDFHNYANNIIEREFNRFQNCQLANTWPSVMHANVPVIVSPYSYLENNNSNQIN